MRRPLLALLLLGIIACPLACNCGQLTAEKAMVATLLYVPPIEVNALALSGVDASFLNQFDANGFDAGGLDAGAFLADASITLDGGFTINANGDVRIEAQTVAGVLFGTRIGVEGVQGIDSAKVVLIPEGKAAAPLESQGEGAYLALSAKDNPNVQYLEGATYRFRATFAGEEYLSVLREAPAAENIASLHPPEKFLTRDAGELLRFVRPEPPLNKDRNLGFVTVFPVSQQGQGEPTYSTYPKEPVELLRIIAVPDFFKQTIVDVPGTAFPDKDTTYVMLFQTVKIGGPETNNLFFGSAIIGGTSEVAIIKTRK